MNREFAPLDRQTKDAIIDAVTTAATTGQHVTVPFRNGDVYAYPHADGTAWGVNGGEDGFCIARGVADSAVLKFWTR